jgi:hypothetical protein
MIYSKNIIVTLFVITTVTLSAQDSTKNYFHKNNYYDLAVAVGNNQYSEALSWTHLHSFGKRNGIKIGYGLRYTNYNASNKPYTTAPAKYTSTKQNLGTLFSDNIEANIDTLTISNAQFNFLNLTIHLQYSFRKFDLNFNIDAAGFSFGNKPTGNYSLSSKAETTSVIPVMQKASATHYNLLLTSDNDIGSLNSELSIRYWITKKIAVRAGFSFLFTEYTTNNKLRLDNDRFRYKSKMVLIGITYSPFHN